MDILQKLVRVNSLLLRGQYESAEHFLDSAIAETRELVAENARLKQSLEITNDTMCQIIEDRAQQSPAVAVPEFEEPDCPHCGGVMNGDCFCDEPKLPSPRITEQDAREIARSFNIFRSQGHGLHPDGIVNKWLRSDEGRELLKKLNKHESVGG